MKRPGARAGFAAAVSGILLAIALALPAPAPAAEWQTVSNRDGMLIERRPHEGSHAYDVRATTRSPLPPSAIFETIWKQREHPQFVPYLKRLDVLSDAGDERVAYEQVSVPLATDRDYTVRLRRRVDPEAHWYEIVFAIANEAGPPPDKHHVRVTQLQGRWLITLGDDGKGSRISYEVTSEPGGAIPIWIVNRMQGEATAKLVRAMLQRTRVTLTESRP